MKRPLMMLTLGLCLAAGAASRPANAQTVIKLWETPPTDNGLQGQEERLDGGRIAKVYEAELHLYPAPAENNNGTCVLICPGGGYTLVAFQHEGTRFAQWLNTQGCSAAVLKYRMPNGHKDIPLQDAVQAMHLLHARAPELGIDPRRIGVMGFSAGGHLASTLSTRYPNAQSRPAFSVLFYPVITLLESTHAGSRNNLLGPNPPQEELEAFSNHLQVNAQTPPTLLLLSADDQTVPISNSLQYFEALLSHGVPASLHIFPTGGHGWGFNPAFAHHGPMLTLLQSFLDHLP